MTDERYKELMEGDAKLTAEEVDHGWHFCNDWDGLLIASHMFEWLSCHCFPPEKKLLYTGPDLSHGTEDLDGDFLLPREGKDFQKDLQFLINRYSKENGSDTPDFVLAKYLQGCLDVFNKALEEREKWYGRAVMGSKSAAPTTDPNCPIQI